MSDKTEAERALADFECEPWPEHLMEGGDPENAIISGDSRYVLAKLSNESYGHAFLAGYAAAEQSTRKRNGYQDGFNNGYKAAQRKAAQRLNEERINEQVRAVVEPLPLPKVAYSLEDVDRMLTRLGRGLHDRIDNVVDAQREMWRKELMDLNIEPRLAALRSYIDESRGVATVDVSETLQNLSERMSELESQNLNGRMYDLARTLNALEKWASNIDLSFTP